MACSLTFGLNVFGPDLVCPAFCGVLHRVWAHLLGCSRVGDGKGRTSMQIWEDEKWCEAVADFILLMTLYIETRRAGTGP